MPASRSLALRLPHTRRPQTLGDTLTRVLLPPLCPSLLLSHLPKLFPVQLCQVILSKLLDLHTPSIGSEWEASNKGRELCTWMGEHIILPPLWFSVGLVLFVWHRQIDILWKVARSLFLQIPRCHRGPAIVASDCLVWVLACQCTSCSKWLSPTCEVRSYLSLESWGLCRSTWHKACASVRAESKV